MKKHKLYRIHNRKSYIEFSDVDKWMFDIVVPFSKLHHCPFDYLEDTIYLTDDDLVMFTLSLHTDVYLEEIEDEREP